MTIYKATDPEFAKFGRIVDGYEKEKQEILTALKEHTPCPEDGTGYVPEEPALQELTAAKTLTNTLFGGLPTQFGWCNGHNTKLNCFEYHRNSEFNLGTEDFILLLARQTKVKDGTIDSGKTKAFLVPKGVLVEVYATSLHYAPCQARKDTGFRVLVALPKGTNVGKAEPSGDSFEDKLLWATNKWLIAHPESSEAKDGAFAGITGPNIDIADLID